MSGFRFRGNSLGAATSTRSSSRMIGVIAVVGLVLAAVLMVVLAIAELPVPTGKIERVIPDDRFPR